MIKEDLVLDMILIKIILFTAPLLLFIFKNILPIMSKIAFSSRTLSDRQIKDEFIKLSIDYLFAAISYLLPKCIESYYYIQKITSELGNAANSNIIDDLLLKQSIEMGKLGRLSVLSFVLILLSPFFVMLNEMAIKYGDVGNNKEKGVIIVIVYLICLGVCGYAISLY